MGELLLELRCIACHKKRSYTVHDVIADQNGKVYIQDTIRCKNCGSLDQCELESGAYLALTAHAIKKVCRSPSDDADEITDDDPLRFAKIMTHDGRNLDPQQAELEYINNISLRPLRADLRVGYGNLLLFLRRRNEARVQYTKALEIEPLAIEALKSLAEMDAEEGRVQQALLKIDKCLRLFDHAKMYRIPRGISRGEVRECLQEMKEDFEARLHESRSIRSHSAYID